MKTKEEWIKDTLESLDDCGRAALSPESRDALLQKTRFIPHQKRLFIQGVFWKVAAAVLVLISVNVFTLIYCLNQQTAEENNTIKSTAKEYFSYISTYNL